VEPLSTHNIVPVDAVLVIYLRSILATRYWRPWLTSFPQTW